MCAPVSRSSSAACRAEWATGHGPYGSRVSRIGIRADFNAALNGAMDLAPEYRLQGNRSYSWEEICDADLKSNFGPGGGLPWFKKHGVLSWPKKPEEVYWRPHGGARGPVYLGFIVWTGGKR